MKRRNVALVIGALLFVCIVIALASPPSTRGTPTATPAPIATLAQGPTSTPAPKATSTNAPTPTTRPSNTPAPTATTVQIAVAKVGEMWSAGGISFGIASVQKMDKADIWTPKAGNTFLAVEAVIQNVDRDTTPYNPLYFTVKDSNGFEYSKTIGGAEPALKSGELVKGDKVRGFVTFEVPQTAKGFVVTYQPLVLLGGYKAIRVDLGQ